MNFNNVAKASKQQRIGDTKLMNASNSDNGYSVQLLIAATILFVLGLCSFLAVNKPFLNEHPQYDFRIYYLASMGLRLGYPLYTKNITGENAPSALQRIAAHIGMDSKTGHYFYPPFFAYVTLPLTYFSIKSAEKIWFYLNFGWLVIAIFLLHRILSLCSDVRFSPFLVAGILLFSPAINFTVYIGQVNLLVLVLILGCWYAYERGCYNLAGGLLTVAIGIKVTPVLLFIYFLINREKRVIVPVIVGGFILFLFGTFRYITYIFYAMPDISKGCAYIANQSLSAFFARLVETAPEALYNEKYGSIKGLLGLLRTVTEFAILGTTLWCFRLPGNPSRVEKFGQLALVLVAVLLFTRIVWVHHHVLALPAVFACPLLISSAPKKWAIRITYVVSLTMLFLPWPLFFSLFLGAPVWSRFLASPYLFGTLLLWLNLVWIFYHKKRPSSVETK